MRGLTGAQLAALEATTWTWADRKELARRVGAITGSAAALEGIGATLGSLVRRGLVERKVIGRATHWRMTDKGSTALRSTRTGRPA